MLLTLSVSLSTALHLFADIKLPRLISDGMVLQRDIPIPIWGWADNGEKVTVKFRGKTYQSMPSDNGKWSITLDKVTAGGPYTMEIVGHNTITVNDILIGDVWLCSGQSNMEFRMNRVKDVYADDIAHSENKQIRHFRVKPAYNFKEQKKDVVSEAGWQYANPKDVLQFSAAAYFFAKELYDRYRVPIGLVHASRGGTPAESWMSEEALKEFPKYYDLLGRLKDDAYIRQIMNREKRNASNWEKKLKETDKGLAAGREWFRQETDISQWKEMKLPDLWENQGNRGVFGAIWFRKEINIPNDMVGKEAQLSLGLIREDDITYINGKKIGSTNNRHLDRNYRVPAGVLVEGKNMITVRVMARNSAGGFVKDKPYYLKAGSNTINLSGAWRYEIGSQMETIPRRTQFEYRPGGLYNAMIAPIIDYGIKGVIWYQGEANASRAKEYNALFPALIKDWRTTKKAEFPFLYVQLASYKAAKDEPSESSWAALREAQLNTLKVSNTGMAVAIDIGEWNDIHPTNKKDVGIRLALAACKVAYGDSKVIYSGPRYHSMKVKGNKVEISFTDVGTGLISKDGMPLKYFAIAGEDGKFVWADAQISGDKVEVWSNAVPNPKAVRYAWADNPDGANLYNREGLPASPFRTGP